MWIYNYLIPHSFCLGNEKLEPINVFSTLVWSQPAARTGRQNMWVRCGRIDTHSDMHHLLFLFLSLSSFLSFTTRGFSLPPFLSPFPPLSLPHSSCQLFYTDNPEVGSEEEEEEKEEWRQCELHEEVCRMEWSSTLSWVLLMITGTP